VTQREVVQSLFWRRIQAGLLQRELAQRACIHLCTIQRAERGAPLRLETLRRIAAALKATPAELQMPPPELPEIKQPPLERWRHSACEPIGEHCPPASSRGSH